jgi:ASC-1-like (ASCH) protein
MLHKMKLNELPFSQIKAGTKTIEVRLLDKKRQRIEIGDIIEFTKLPKGSEMIRTKVIDLLKYKMFPELFDISPAEDFGGRDKEDLMSIYKYYSKDDEQKYGVVGIKLKLL